jgi:predicted O-methyltransferase YrrM
MPDLSESLASLGGVAGIGGDPNVSPALAAPADPASGSIPPGSPTEEATSGSDPYLQTLARIHQTLAPQLYLEIGVREGNSLSLARRIAIGIDPAMRPAAAALPADLYHETSDEFFDRHASTAITRPVDLAFVDGLHLFEYALRDFMNVERRASRYGLVVMDDIFPNNPAQGSRHRRTRAWAGDVWRVAWCLRDLRTDLLLLPLDCSPTGLLLIAGLDPDSCVLQGRYDAIVAHYLSRSSDPPPPTVVRRDGALRPTDSLVDELLDGLRRLAGRAAGRADVQGFLDNIRSSFGKKVSK